MIKRTARQIIKQVENKLSEELDRGYMVSASMKENRVFVSLSSWSDENYWTRDLISHVESCDLRFLHIEPGEETVTLGVFEIE